jgi:hypothetical protein
MGELTDKILLKLISGIHIIFICFVVFAQFFDSNYILFIHSIIMPFIMFHWLLNNNMCALTLLETKLREKITGNVNNKKECISCKIIEPIYDFKNNYADRAKFIYGATTTLWIISLIRLYFRYKRGFIKTYHDLFII